MIPTEKHNKAQWKRSFRVEFLLGLLLMFVKSKNIFPLKIHKDSTWLKCYIMFKTGCTQNIKHIGLYISHNKGPENKLIPRRGLCGWGPGPFWWCLERRVWRLIAASGWADRRNTDTHSRELASLSAWHGQQNHHLHSCLTLRHPRGDKQPRCFLVNIQDSALEFKSFTAGRFCTNRSPF